MPIDFVAVMRSPGTKTWAIGSTINGSAPMNTPATPLPMNCCAQASNAKGSEFVTMATASAARQSARPCGLRVDGNRAPMT